MTNGGHPSRSIHQAFRWQRAQRPEAEAVVCSDASLSYCELDRKSDQFAGFLRQACVAEGAAVVTVFDRSVAAIVALLGILKAGAAYVALDPQWPAERLGQAALESGACLILADRPLLGGQPGVPPVILLSHAAQAAAGHSAPLDGASRPEGLAYVMYTSGSTGQPKGVMIPHRAVVNLVIDNPYARFGPDETFLSLAPLAFDASTFEIWGALLNGGRLAIMPDRAPSLASISDAIRRQGVTTLWLTAGLFHLMVDQSLEALRPLRQLLAGGDALSRPHVERALRELPGCRLINGYGPTENTTFSCCCTLDLDSLGDEGVPIGTPIARTEAYVLDDAMRKVPDGTAGTLYVGGHGLARGYLNRPEETARSFVPHPFDPRPGARLYCTGDEVRRRPDGRLAFVGRADRQVKVNGQRVELEAVELAVRQAAGVGDAAVVARTDPVTGARIDAFVVLQGGAAAVAALQARLRAALPAAMRPASITALDALPLTANGKVDRAALSLAHSPSTPMPARPHGANETERALAEIWGVCLGRPVTDLHTNFFDLGGTSLELLRAQAEISRRLGAEVTTLDLFEFATISALARRLGALAAPGGPAPPASAPHIARPCHPAAAARRPPAAAPVNDTPAAPALPGDAIAIIGMSGRFPGAGSVDAFWDNLLAGRETISRFKEAELEDAFPEATRGAPNFVRARSVLEGIDGFDAGFFGMRARDAALTDPQHRIFLECAWEALEDAGYDPARCGGAVGVFAGCSMNSYFMNNVCPDRDAVAAFTSAYGVGEYPTLLGASIDFLATRVAYKLDLRGPSMTLQTACSTSLVAVAQACQALLLFQADMMLAGGVSITLPQRRGYLHEPGGMVSPDGHCRTFDAAAAGTVFGNGAGAVLLKRLDDAVADGDHIYAVIRGSAVNNDGAAKVGFTAPSIDGQAAVLRAAYAAAGVPPQTVGFVECHGTATPLGDPIEVAALVRAFGPAAHSASCALGSVKPNIGHLDAAAGIAGLIKAALCLSRERIPGTLHFTKLNPHIDLRGSPFRIAVETTAWPRGASPRRAGVSALGVGGTNVHVVLEEAPEPVAASPAAPLQYLTLSARSAAALAQRRTDLARHMEAHPEQGLPDIAHTLQVGRRGFEHRWAAVCRGCGDALAALRDGRDAGPIAAAAVPVAFMFPGQGSQHVGMGRGLYRDHPGFRQHFDACAALLEPLLGADLRKLLFGPATEAAAERLRSTDLAQPAIFGVGYALARSLMEHGVQPAAMLGHSVGEFVAATVAGVFSLEDAVSVVAARGRLMAGLPEGGMLAVRLGEGELRPLLGAELSLAAVNGPALCVAAGPPAALAALSAALSAREVGHRALHTSHAFHSAAMDPILEPLADFIRGITLRPPTLPYVSGVTGVWITEAQATSAEYWARHCREPVRFADGLSMLAADLAPVLLELGPGRALSAMARQGAGRSLPWPPLATLGEEAAAEDDADHRAFLGALGTVWTAGVPIDWTAGRGAEGRRRVPLPTYPFQRGRHWIDPPRPSSQPAEPAPSNASANSMPSPPVVPIPPSGEPLCSAVRASVIELLRDLSGEAMPPDGADTPFLELGFDSLFLSQLAQQVQRRFQVKTTFRQLLATETTVARLAAHVASHMPEILAAQLVPAATPPLPPPTPASPAAEASVGAPDVSAVQAIMRDQLAAMSGLLSQQLAALQALGTAPAASAPAVAAPAPRPADGAGAVRLDGLRPSRAGRSHALGPEQRRHVAELVARYVARTPGSKRLTQQHRAGMADPRAAAGIRADWKEMVYPLTTARSSGALLWDVDGNDYVDLLNGFGQTAFGHAPRFVTEAVAAQLAQGYEIGPQTPLAGEVAELVRELTGNERVAFCNTGSEAVMAAMRVARAVTARDRIVLFSGAYHGQFDEVLVKAGPGRAGPGAVPVASGIPLASAGSVTVLEYAAAEALDWIQANIQSIAAVIAEPVQSRRPGLQPREFLAALRDITLEGGAALVFDEVVTGFRSHPGGMQEVFGIRADLATYGKVAGGGLPIGILAGKRRFMDALDGGDWRYGDDSMPEADVTFFAGTFVRHPLALAAARAVLLHLKAEGPSLQERLTRQTTELVGKLNDVLASRGLLARIPSFASFFYVNLDAEEPNASLLYYHLRLRGIHIQEGFPCFLTTAHGEAEVERIVTAWRDSIDAMQAAGFFRRKEPSLPAPQPPKVEEPALTPSQMEVWLAGQVSDAASCAFNESVCLRLEGALDVPALQAALADVVARHDALRLRFSRTGERMRAAGPEPMPLVPIPLANDAALDAFIKRDAETPFDLVAGPVARAALLRLSERDHALVFTAHHIVCDGWSMNVVIAELSACYAARLRGTVAALPPAESVCTHAAQREAEPVIEDADRVYWMARFAGPLPALRLPGDRPPPAVRSFAGATVTASVAPDLLGRLRSAGAQQGCTLFVILLAAFSALAGRLSGQQDVVVGVPTSGQALPDGTAVVGHWVNMLPVRAQWDETTSVAELLRALHERVLDDREHGGCTLGTIVQCANPARGLGGTALASVQFNLERLGPGLALPGLAARVVPNPKRFVQFELFLNATETDDGLRLDCDYSSELFDQATVRRWLGHYQQVLEAFAADPAAPVSGIALLSGRESAGWQHESSVPLAETAAAATVHALFEREAARRPDASAIRFGDAVTSYRALDERANRLAHHLRRRVGPGKHLVGIALERSADLPAALLATLKAGCAYVPLDPHYPLARQLGILRDAGVTAVICDDNWPGRAAGDAWEVIAPGAGSGGIAAEPATAPEGAAEADDLAYVIYTSGSTGEPKGVEVTHGAVVNFLLSMGREPGLAENDVLCAVTTAAFDIACLELFLPLSVGATVAIAAAAEISDGTALKARLRACGATAMQATPAAWRLLLEAGWQSHAGFKMLCGGERWPRELADKLLAGGGSLWNMFGPTETTVWSSVARVLPGTAPITIGAPIANTSLYILDEHDRPVPVGVPGQLHIGGAGLARGYRGDPARTAEKFVTDPFGPGGGRMFRTGDVARRLESGEIVVLGRLDLQIKLRGFRIEIEEIEAALAERAGLAAAAVALRDDGSDTPRLVAYYVERPGMSHSAAQLREALRPVLPDHMIPSQWVPLPALPVLSNGKLDRAALPDRNGMAPPPRRASRPPATPAERTLCAIWQDVLGTAEVGPDDDIFELGVDSIQLFQITARANRQNLRVSAKQLVEHRTVASLAAALGPGAQPAAALPSLRDAAALRHRMASHAAPERPVPHLVQPPR